MTVRVVVDSCVALKWFASEQNSDMAKRLFDPSVERLAPDLILVEIANALWKNERLGRIRRPSVEQAIVAAPHYFSGYLRSADLMPEASELARSIDQPV